MIEKATGSLSIRVCRLEDMEVVLELWQQADATPGVTDNTDDLRRAITESPAHVLVAEVDGRVIGSIIGVFDGWRGNVYRLAVHPDFRRHGVARSLVGEVERKLAEQGAKRITALVEKDHPWAMSFWEAVEYRVNERVVRRVRTAREPSMLVDVSHVVEHGMVTYKGLPAPLICDFLSREQSRSHYAPGTEFHIGKIEMVANTGTYLDSPFHRYDNGKDLSELPLERLANLQGIVIRSDSSKGRAISRAALKDHDLRGKAILVQTGWDAHWRTDQHFEGHPFLTRDAAEYLVEVGVALVGIDSLNIDDTSDLTRPVHSILLASEIPIVEHLRGLSQLPDVDFRFFAVPVKVKSMGTFPVRAFGLVEGRKPNDC